jgi:uncharacterized linocin/CFP29 family protein
MNFFRRELAPIGPSAWNEIDAVAKRALSANLSGRQFIAIDGPHGLDYASVPLGRLSLPEGQNPAEVAYGVHQTLPLTEARVYFTLKTWELDNLDRGAKDIQLNAVVEAARKIAAFEDKAVFDGFAPAGVVGLKQALAGPPIPISLDETALVEAVAEAQGRLLKAGVEGGADLVVSPPLWKFLAHSVPGGALRSLVEKRIGGRVVLSDWVNGALLAANRGGDLELTVGQDFAIGYHSHTATEIRLFLTESFTFRVIAPEALVGFALSAA